MSIASELTNLEGNIEDSYDAVNDMGGIVPAQRNMDNLDQAIRTIPQSTGPTPGDGTLTIQQDGSTLGTFTANQSTNTTVNITSPGVTTFYFTNNVFGPDVHISIYSDQAKTTAVPASTVVDAYKRGKVILVGSYNNNHSETYELSEVTETTDSFVYLVAFGRERSQVTWAYSTPSSTTTMNFFDTQMEKKLVAGSNITLSSDVNATTISATDTTYSDFTGATSSVAGTSGLVPAPAAGDENKLLRGDGTWVAQNEPIVAWLNWNSIGTDLEVLGTVTGQFMDGYTSATAVGASFFAGAVSDNKQVVIRTGGGLPVPGRDWATEIVRPVQVNYDGMGSATMYFWHETMFVCAQCPDSGTTWTFTKLSV